MYSLSPLSQPLAMAPRQIPHTVPLNAAYSSMTSTPSSGPRTASNSFLSTASTVDEERSSVVALTDLHEQPINSAQRYGVGIDNLDGDGALQEEVSEAILENKNGYNEFEEASTEVSNASSSREDLTSASEVELSIGRQELTLNTHDKGGTDIKLTPIKQLTYTEGSSLLSPVRHSTSHFSALSGLESVESPIKTHHT